MGEAECRTTDRPVRRSPSGRYTLRFDIQERDPSTVTVLAVEEVDGTDIEEMAPLHDSIDPAALDGLFDSAAPGSVPSDVSVTFRFEGYEVTIEGTGRLTLKRA